MQIRTRREKVDGQPAMKNRVYFGLVSVIAGIVFWLLRWLFPPKLILGGGN